MPTTSGEFDTYREKGVPPFSLTNPSNQTDFISVDFLGPRLRSSWTIASFLFTSLKNTEESSYTEADSTFTLILRVLLDGINLLSETIGVPTVIKHSTATREAPNVILQSNLPQSPIIPGGHTLSATLSAEGKASAPFPVGTLKLFFASPTFYLGYSNHGR
jgi:hypothetical protein